MRCHVSPAQEKTAETRCIPHNVTNQRNLNYGGRDSVPPAFPATDPTLWVSKWCVPIFYKIRFVTLSLPGFSFRQKIPTMHMYILTFHSGKKHLCQSQWPRSLRLRSAAERLLGSWVRIPPEAWVSVSCTVFVLSGRGLCDGPIPRPEESYRVCCELECDQVKINNLDTYYE
jgi:hypothetical protein